MKNAKPIGSVLVVGGGITGMQSALDMADAGYYVYLVESSPAIGGAMAQLDKTFPTNDCAMWIISPKLVEVGRHLNIELLTLSEVTAISGSEGNFTINVRQAPRYVDMDKCIACGACAEKCPAKASDAYNAGLAKRKAAYVPYPQAVPLKYALDPASCIYLLKGRCGACKKICPTGAIDFDDKGRELTLNVGAVVLTAGYSPYSPTGQDNYGHGRLPNVLTSMEFERMLSAGGPSAGHITRPSDGSHPKKIAWLQCVGSRDLNRCGNEYCSAVCCMYAVKEAVIAREHVGKELDAAIFFMDMRTHGKDFEKYYERAKSDGVRFLRARVHTIEPADESGTLNLRYVNEEGQTLVEPFDMAVLSVGMEPAPSAIAAAKQLGVELGPYRFVQSSDTTPVATSKPGIFVAGVLQGPKDIPQSVMEASAAACSVGIQLAAARGTLTQAKTFPEERPVEGGARIGVFVCNCGVNIGGIADVPAVVEYAKSLPGVVYAQENLFSCSQDTQAKMAELIQEKGLNRVVVAACTPRTHEPLFQETLRNAGVNAYLFEMANIRNQCTWVHSGDKQAATAKAKDLVRMSVARAGLLEPIADLTVPVEKTALVIGGGVAGMTAALSLADSGFAATLVEKSDALGGAARELSHTWRGQDVSAFLADMEQRITSHPAITVLKGAEVTAASGFVGNFESEVSVTGEKRTIHHGALIIATGGHASTTEEYLYGKHPAVCLWHDLEHAPERVKAASSVAFIQCVGSRDDKRPYCSRICCTSSVMQAISIKEQNPAANVYILYRDIRTFGERELLYKKARELGVIFIRYNLARKPVVEAAGQGLRIQIFDPILQQDLSIEVDLLTLATAIEPNDNNALASLYKLPLNAERFFMEAHAKLRPVDFASDGIYLCGLAHYPKGTDESIAQALAAAGRAATVLARDSIQVSPLVSQINTDKCIGCGLCTEVCAFGANVLDDVPGKGKRARNIPASCKGCGLCAASCPVKAIDMLHFRDTQIAAAVCAVG